MAARGAEGKKYIFEKILETFDGAFMADAKTLRVPVEENGERIEIKVTLTAAKDIFGDAPETGVPATTTSSLENTVNGGKLSPDEEAEVQRLLKTLNL